MSTFAARAPSNIALVKYMGKLPGEGNLPENPSLSLTLRDLCSVCEVDVGPGPASVRWDARPPATRLPRAFQDAALGDAAVGRMLRHVERVRAALPAALASQGLTARADGALRIAAANTFPASAGIASSASSFAAVTLAVAHACAADPDAFARAWDAAPALRAELARFSRQGSGSSCRSFDGPWVLWARDSAAPVPAAVGELRHFVLVLSRAAKAVPSSEAHARVKSSPLWAGRPERAGERARALREALSAGDWSACSRLAWAEAWEMHSLFHTSAEPFTYWEPATLAALQWLAPHVGNVVITLDAGPNVHVTVRANSAADWERALRERFGGEAVIADAPGPGARLLAGGRG